MSIVVVAGDPGNGKGVLALHLMEEAVMSGRPVYTNIELLPGCPFQHLVARIDDPEGKWPVYRGTPGKDGKPPSPDYLAFWHYVVPGSVIILDEADSYFDCSDHSEMGRDVRQFMKQHRKLQLDMIFIVQRVENLYIRIRRLTQRFILCEWNWRSMRFFQWLAQYIGVDRAMGMTRYLRSEFSSEMFGPRTHIGDGFIPYAEAKKKYFGDPWYSTEQLLGDTSYLRHRQMQGM